MLTGDDRAHRTDEHVHEHDRDHDLIDHAATAALTATETPSHLPILEGPSWLDDEELEEMQAPRDSAFRGIWIGVAAAALTFVLVFAIPHWLGWYDVGPTTPRAKRELTPDSVISTVTAKPSTATGEAAAGPTVASAPAAATPPAAVTPPPAAAEPKAPALPHESKPAPRETKAPVATVASHEAKPAPAARESKPASAAAVARRRTFAVQIAAFKNARQAGRVAENAKRAGYAADVLRVESSAVPWVVRIGGYSTREQAESARDALARKGFRGGFII
jgi:cell division septation protein DedD